MYKVVDENPEIIARFSPVPIENTDRFELIVDHKLAKKKIESAEHFLCNPNANPLDKVKRLYKLIDWFLEHIDIANQAVCQKGCAHCCSLDVDVSLIEALYIADNTGLTVVDREQRINRGYHKTKSYCQFLDQETATCSIREFRPLMCRTFFAMDNPKFCEMGSDFKKHAIFNLRSTPLFEHFGNELTNISQNKNADIREWFKEYTTIEYPNSYANNLDFDIK